MGEFLIPVRTVGLLGTYKYPSSSTRQCATPSSARRHGRVPAEPFFFFFSPFFLSLSSHFDDSLVTTRYHVSGNKFRDRYCALHTEGHLSFNRPIDGHISTHDTAHTATLTIFDHSYHCRRAHPPSRAHLVLSLFLIFYLSFRWTCFRHLCRHQQVLAAAHGHRDQRSHRSGGIFWSRGLGKLEGGKRCRRLVAQANENFHISFPWPRYSTSRPLWNFDAQRPSVHHSSYTSRRNLTAALTGLPHPYPFPYDIQALLHFTLPLLRILLLVILFFALINPVVTYTTVTSADEVREDQPTATSLLLSTQEYVNPISGLGLTVRRTYGTLTETTNSPVQRAPSLEPPDHVASKIQVHLYTPLFQADCSSYLRSRRLRRRRLILTRPGAKYSDA